MSEPVKGQEIGETTATQSSVSKAPRVIPEQLWRCDCGTEVLGVSFYTWREDPPDWFIEVYKMPGAGRFGWRFKKAMGLLIGREVVIDAVSLDKEKVAELISFLRLSIASVTEPTRGTFTDQPRTVTHTADCPQSAPESSPGDCDG